ncbi:MAG: B12-binding domain-containing radical SAM protein [Calditrichaeota bacterium]|nr:B12-binding domain-containing radical SAM protein [Calditrichota bacterium]
MKVVFIHTAISRCGFNSYGTSQEGSWISHGLCQLSAVAQEAGYEVDFIDLRRLSGWSAFYNALIGLNPDVVGFTMMTVDYDVVKEGVKVCRKALPDAKIIIGGPHPTILPDDVLEIEEIDYIIQGEGEISLIELLVCIEKGIEFPRISRGKVPNLDNLPHYDRRFYPERERAFHPVFIDPFVTLITGRGCMYNCSFCQPAERMIFGRKVRSRSVDNVISELKMLRDSIGFNSFMITDDCFTEDPDYVNEFCDKYSNAGFNQTFITQTRADIICRKPDMIKRLREVGNLMFSIGFESGNDRIMKLLRKGVTVEQNYRAAEICRKLDIMIDANYMLGLPTETEAEMMDTVDMINSINPEIRSPSFYSPHPGTDLYDYCVEHNLLLSTDYSQFRRNPYGEKIKGVDYKLVKKMLWLSRGSFRLTHLKFFISDHPLLYKTLKWISGSLRSFKSQN